MLENKVDNRRVVLWSGITLLILGAVLLYNLTHSGLRYDEAIEYWYSKIVSGPVPGGREYNSMYERICATYQPPLYNWLMHLWLQVWDTEFSFRAFGVVVTLLGSAGVFFAVLHVSKNLIWSSATTILYGVTYQIVYYTQECSEYALMVCFVAWMMFFGVRLVDKLTIGNLAGFYSCAVLAVYSQYGAVFSVLGIWLVITWKVWKSKSKTIYAGYGIVSGLTLVLAVIPLLIFFLLPQMQMHVLAITENHIPEFNNNFVYDFICAVYNTFTWAFLREQQGLKSKIICLAAVAVIIVILFGLIKSKEKKEITNSIIVINILIWMLFYILVKCKYYAYTPYIQGFGNRYAIFFFPIWAVSLSILLYFSVQSYWKSCRIWKLGKYAIVCACVMYVALNGYYIMNNWIKDDTREATQAWYEIGAYDETTIVDGRSDCIFQYYLLHDEMYDEKYQDNLILAAYWTYEKFPIPEMQRQLNELFEGDFPQSFYYIVGKTDYIDSILAAIEGCGYTGESIYEGQSRLVRFTKE